mgnify:FL=1
MLIKAKILAILLFGFLISCGEKSKDRRSSSEASSDQIISDFNPENCEGDAFISYNSDLKIQDLAGCEAINGSVYFHYNPGLADFSQLSKVKTVSGDFSIVNNEALTSLKGLENLSAVGGFFSVSRNPALKNLAGLNILGSIGGDLIIDGNGSLEDSSQLSSLKTIGANLLILSLIHI